MSKMSFILTILAFMQLISSDKPETIAMLERMLESYECPAILVSVDYEILATNSHYEKQFGSIDIAQKPRCFEISHGYTVPCDQAGEDCPLIAAQQSGHKERVLHIHQTPRGKEHVDVEMLPIHDSNGELAFFVEFLRAIPLVSGQITDKEMVGVSESFNNMLGKITRVGNTDASVLLLGESGTGKELAARAIHMASDRKSHPLVSLECAGLTDSLFESELFGHVKGAFTGAQTNKKGLVEQANGGTLFLDEIGDIPLSMQVKLLRLLESRTFRPVGSTAVKTTDFRLICATHKNLSEMVDDGLFRQDLYYRINVFPITVPSLQQRLNDIPIIAKALLAQISPDHTYRLTNSAISALKKNRYKGNIRELRNLLSRAVILSDNNLIDNDQIAQSLNYDERTPTNNNSAQVKSTNDQIVSLKEYEKKYLESLLINFDGDKNKVAETAGISLRSLYRKLQ